MIITKLINSIKQKRSIAVVGLDPNLEKLPVKLKTPASAVLEFNKKIINATAPYCIAVKPQLAYYEALGPQGIVVLEETIKYAKAAGLQVIADAKRGDIGSTSQAYAEAYLGNNSALSSDYLTVNPYMGMDTLQPFVDVAKQYDKGIFTLVKTSNPGSTDLQNLSVVLSDKEEDELSELGVDVKDGHSMLCNVVALKLRNLAVANTSSYGFVGAVVGATQSKYVRDLRMIMRKSFFLVPGYGAQGATAKDLKCYFNEDGLGAIVNSSRGILYAYEKENDPVNFAKHAQDALVAMNDDLSSLF